MSALHLLLVFVRVSALTFGGGYAMVPLFQYEMVNRLSLMTAEQFANLVALAQITPGPIGFNAATYAGMVKGGLVGSLTASLGMIVPSLTITLLVAVFMSKLRDAKWMQSMMCGIRPCVLGIIASAVVFFARTSVCVCWQGALIFALVLFFRFKWRNLSPLWSLLASAVLGYTLLTLPLAAFAETMPVEKCGLKAGIISDSHIRADEDGTELKACLRDFRDRGVDVVLHAGDVVEDGAVSEYANFRRIWLDVFGSLPGKNRTPELLVSWGNHDYRKASKLKGKGAGAPGMMVNDKDGVWKMLFGEPFPGETFVRKIRGVQFVVCHFGSERKVGNWLKAHPHEVDTSKLFFCLQHPPIPRTVFSVTNDPSTVKSQLNAYPTCFSISGHIHSNLADDSALWQGSFTAMSAGITRGAVVRHCEWTPKYENGYFNKKLATPPYQHMDTCNAHSGWFGSVLTLTDNEVRVERIDFRSGKPVGDDWVMPLPLETHPEAPHILATSSKGPEFAVDAKVSVVLCGGRNSMGESERQVVATVPQARPVARYGRTIVNEFEFVAASDGATLKKMETLQEGQGLPIGESLAYPSKCVIGLADLPKGILFKVRVTPMNAAGVRGKSLVSETQKAE